MALKSVWMVTFEAIPFAKVGGLAEVPTNLLVPLSKKGIFSAIIMPSHSPVIDPRAEIVERLIEGKKYVFEKTMYKGIHFLRVHSDFLDDSRVYSEDVLLNKVVDLAKALPYILTWASDLGLVEPDILHFHDWHSVVPLLKAKEKRGEDEKPYLVYHVHLLVRRKLDWATIEAAGLRRDWVHKAYLNGKTLHVTLREVFDSVEGFAEKLGLAESDQLITVSKSYLEEDLLGFLGRDVTRRGLVVYNGTDWQYETLIQEVLSIHRDKIEKTVGNTSNRSSLRKYLLLHALGQLPKGEPKIPDEKIKEYILERVAPPFREELKLDPFPFDGPLAITTGRLSRQKGFDTMAEAIEILLREFGEARIIFLVLPVWGGEKYVDVLIELSREYPYNVRVIFGIAPSVYKLSHLAADIFVAPSRWEPFGIMAIEALAAGCPVVGSKVGGLKETVLDIHEHGIKGTGLLVPPDNPYELADAMRNMLAFMEASNQGSLERYHRKIGDEKLLSILEEYLDAGEIIRKNAIDRVSSTFTWEKAADMLLEAYSRLAGPNTKGGV
ncbi:glycosyltransferase [Infirmifilum uzonense]|uniref:glycosyltransferase n=1 Tax=Infirmifilum uzonense TaxID=1550241 RepID=UPI003C7355EA